LTKVRDRVVPPLAGKAHPALPPYLRWIPQSEYILKVENQPLWKENFPEKPGQQKAKRKRIKVNSHHHSEYFTFFHSYLFFQYFYQDF
jgi:hypothetical protein